MPLASVTLDDKYTADSGRVYLSGVQALVRLPMMQRARDRAAGLDTGGCGSFRPNVAKDAVGPVNAGLTDWFACNGHEALAFFAGAFGD